MVSQALEYQMSIEPFSAKHASTFIEQKLYVSRVVYK